MVVAVVAVVANAELSVLSPNAPRTVPSLCMTSRSPLQMRHEIRRFRLRLSSLHAVYDKQKMFKKFKNYNRKNNNLQ